MVNIDANFALHGSSQPSDSSRDHFVPSLPYSDVQLQSLVVSFVPVEVSVNAFAGGFTPTSPAWRLRTFC